VKLKYAIEGIPCSYFKISEYINAKQGALKLGLLKIRMMTSWKSLFYAECKLSEWRFPEIYTCRFDIDITTA